MTTLITEPKEGELKEVGGSRSESNIMLHNQFGFVVFVSFLSPWMTRFLPDFLTQPVAQ